MTVENQSIAIHNVWKKSVEHDAVIAFWKNLNALTDSATLEKRVHEVVMVAKDKNDQVVGVTSAHEAHVKYLNDNYFYNFRALIHPAYRIPGLVDKLAVETIDLLEKEFLNGNTKCIGIITLIENNHLKEDRKEAVYPSTGLTFIGYSKKGYQIRVRYFKGARI